MKIKFTLFALLMMCVFIHAQSSPVSLAIASKVALNFYITAAGLQKNFDNKQLKIKETFTVAENGINYYYIVNIDKGGFVIISAEDALQPILGYSFEKNYSGTNPSPEFIWWMSGYKDQIRYAQTNNLNADKKTIEMWNEYVLGNLKPKKDRDITVGPLVLTRWDQGVPYNELCPLDGGGPGGHVLVGCVATAMGQIMNYYKYPLQGSDEHCYSSSYGLLCSYYRDSTYNWNAMQNQPTTSCIPLASLLYQCGIAVNMQYGPTASGAYSYAVPGTLITYWNYAGSTNIVNRSSYSQYDFENLLQQQLNQKSPMYYSGQGPGGGHAFVCDGYQTVGSDSYYHFNWGWSGYADGWFNINNLNPGGYTFNQQQQVIINSIPGTGYPYNCSGQKTLTNLKGVFEDGSGYMDYQPNLNCTWLIDPADLSGTDRLNMTFDLFEITDANDIITIYNGDNTSAPVLATFHGTSQPTIGQAITSTAPKVLVKFSTNGSNNGGGWHISYSNVSKIHCKEIDTLTHSWHVFDDGSGPNYHYSNGTACVWMLKPSNATYIKLKFNELNTEEGSDKIYIYNAFNANPDSLIGTYSGNTIPDTIVSTTGKMFVIFVSNDTKTYPGWSAIYISDGPSGAGLNELPDISDFSVFPNPAENIININFSSNFIQNVNVTINDMVGNNVYSENKTNLSGRYENSLDLTTFAKGIYIVHIKTNNENYYKKIVIY